MNSEGEKRRMHFRTQVALPSIPPLIQMTFECSENAAVCTLHSNVALTVARPHSREHLQLRENGGDVAVRLFILHAVALVEKTTESVVLIYLYTGLMK